MLHGSGQLNGFLGHAFPTAAAPPAAAGGGPAAAVSGAPTPVPQCKWLKTVTAASIRVTTSQLSRERRSQVHACGVAAVGTFHSAAGKWAPMGGVDEQQQQGHSS